MFKKIHKILLWALLLAVLLTACKAKSSPGPAATPTLTPYPTLDPELLGRIQEDRALKEKFQDIKRRNPALSSVVNEFIIKYQREGHDAAIEWAREQQLLDPEDNVAITVILDTKDTAIIQDFVTKAEGYGCIVLGYLGNEVEILIPLSVIETYAGSEDSDSIFDDLATLDHVETIKFTAYLGTMGGIESEGVGVIGADQWHEQGYRGQNVKVGIIDYGFDGYRDLLGTELPTSVTAQSFVYYSDVDNTGNEHGTAVAEIIYDVAPDAELYFARIDGGASCFAKAARWLADQGVAIINHSGGYPFGPFDGTNPRDALVDEITARDILWLNSAGNDGEAHWRGMFEDTDGDGFHNFAPNVNRIPIWGQRGVQLHWWNNPGEDYDIYVYNKNDWVMAKSLDDQKSGASPMEETARFPMIRGINYYVAIKAEQDAQPVMVDLFVSNGMIQDATYVVREHSVTNPGTAKTALSVGATWWSDDAITTYSSGGPTEDGRLKPEISAPAEVDNVTYSVEGFGGTSAASPHVAGAAALVLSAYSEMSAQDLKTYLLDHALDLGPSGADNVYGYGRVDLPPQGEVATDSTPTPEATDSDAILTATTTPPAPTDTTATPVTVATATSKRDERLLSTASAIVETKVLPTAKSFATEVAPTVDAFVTEILPTVVEKATEIGPTVRAIAHTDTPVPESSDEPTSEDSLWVSIVVIAIVVLILAIAIMWVLFKQPRPQSAQPPSPTPSAPAYYPVQPPATPPTVQAPVTVSYTHLTLPTKRIV